MPAARGRAGGLQGTEMKVTILLIWVGMGWRESSTCEQRLVGVNGGGWRGMLKAEPDQAIYSQRKRRENRERRPRRGARPGYGRAPAVRLPSRRRAGELA